MTSLIVKNGTVVTASESFRADVKAEDGVITKIASSMDEDADRMVDARGKLVVPGGIDGHTHFEMPFMGTTTADDFESGTVSAAAGGVTTVVDFAVQQKGGSLLEALESWHSKARGKAVVDYGFHMIFRDLNAGTMGEIRRVMAAGVNTFKMFTTYRREGLMLDDGEIAEVMKEVSSAGGLVAIHAESNWLAERNVQSFLGQGKTAALYHLLSKPQIVEGEAVQRAITLARYVGASMYIVHLSSRMGRELVREARLSGLPVFAETCPHYLVFNDSVYRREDAAHFVMSPPIKAEEDRLALWQGLIDGDVKTVGSDHADFTREQKALGKDDFTKIPNGVAGTEVILPLLYSEGVGKGRLSVNRFVQVTSTNAARAYNIFPRKGTIAVGSDADMVVIDPDRKVRLTADFLHAKIDYSIYEDYVTQGYPVATISRGEVVMEENQVVARPGRGSFVPRGPFPGNRCPLFA
ncbi:MAG: dihydropyrimidinase [Nitrososphaerota archaeon]|nr:dihydropyrimidinase [Nitrososphaerota archaeon]MDG6939162.1 dihydropyrimidinase [Nitrososphaerota archaeon]